MNHADRPVRYWSDLNTEAFATLDKRRAIALLPVGATEQHGPHLPLSVDSDLADGIVRAALPHLAPDLPVLVLPTQAVGFSPEHMAFAGTLSLKAETVIRVWTEIAEGVAASGVSKLLIFNTHGGQVGLLDTVARDLRARLGMLVVSTSWFQLPLLDEQGRDVNERFSAHERRFGSHAGQIETAMMMALRPGCVHTERLSVFASTKEDRARELPILGNGRSARFAWATQDLNPAGAVGNAAAATAEDGQALVQAAGLALARLLGEIDQLPADVLKG